MPTLSLVRCRRLWIAAAACLLGLVVGGAWAVAAEPWPDEAAALRESALGVLRQAAQRADAVGRRAEGILLSLDYPNPAAETAAAVGQRVRPTDDPEAEVWRRVAEYHAARQSKQRRDAIHGLTTLLDSSSAQQRRAAAEALAELVRQSPEADVAALRRLTEAPDLVLAASGWYFAAAEPNSAEMARAKLAELLGHDEAAVAAVAARRLRQSGATASDVLLAAQVAMDSSHGDPAAHAEILGLVWQMTGGQSAAAQRAALRHLADEHPAARLAACEVLADLGTAADLSWLAARLNDSDDVVRLAAARAILRIQRRRPHRLVTVDWMVIGLYGAAMLAVGWYYAGKNESTEQYLLGGRNMRPSYVGLSLFATLLSTVTYLSVPGEMIREGPMILAQPLAFPLVLLVVGWLLIPYIMRLRATSAYEILEARLGFSVRLVGSLSFLGLRLLWMALVIHATADKLLVPITGIAPDHAWLIGVVLGAVTIAYTSLGGMRAVVVTDVLQTVILFSGALLTLGLVTLQLGGVSSWWSSQWDANWQPVVWGFNPNVRLTVAGVTISGFTWWLCTSGSDQVAVQRYLSTRDAGTARRVLGVSLAANTVVLVFLGVLGFALLGYFRAHPEMLPDGQRLATHADRLFPQYIVFGLPAGVTGIVIAGLLAAAMSSLSSGLNSSCAVITVDFVDRFRSRPIETGARVLLAKGISLAVGTLVVVVSLLVNHVPGNLLEQAFRVSNLLVAPLFVLLFMAMFIPWASAVGTLLGWAASVAVAVGIAYPGALGLSHKISFIWLMPAALVVGIAVGAVASAGLRGRSKSSPEG